MPIEASAGRDTGGEHALIQLSEDTGGKYYYASSIQQLDQAFRAISDELRTQYLLAYYPAQRLADSDFRRIEVSLAGVPEASNYKARHRTGYYTSKFFLRPHYQLEGLTVSLRLVSKLPSEKGG